MRTLLQNEDIVIEDKMTLLQKDKMRTLLLRTFLLRAHHYEDKMMKNELLQMMSLLTGVTVH